MGRASRENKLMAIFLFSLFFLSGVATFALIGEQWSIAIGGAGWDGAYSIRLTSDGGYILAGITSYGSGGEDAWLVKIDSTGHLQWNKTYGGARDDRAYSVQQTLDYGYIFAGETSSYGVGGPFDGWIVKVDPNGSVEWSKAFGTEASDTCTSVEETSDGGYILAGHTIGYIWPDFVFYAWIMKLDSKGEMLWNKTYDDPEADELMSIVQTNDGGYAAAGYKTQFDYGAWVIKIDSEGNTEWSETYGVKGPMERAFCIQQTSDGGYIIAGDRTANETSDSDFYLLKIDSSGSLQWSNAYGGNETDIALCVRQKSDGGYVMTGYTFSYDHNHAKALLVCTDPVGTPQLIRSIGGRSDDYAYCVLETLDGRYVIAGTTYSFGNGAQVWVVKV